MRPKALASHPGPTLGAMRLTQALGVLAIAACHSAPGSTPAPSRCGPGVPANAQHPMATKPTDLAGDYALVQVQTQPLAGSVSEGRLHLAPLDSAARAGAVGGAVRNLIGWLDPAAGSKMSRTSAASRDPAQPGAVLAGEHLMLGDIGVTDGYTEQLTITAVAPEGFWGWWEAPQGWKVAIDTNSRRVLPDPAGYFCALRVRP
jgi:hypothetical protein